MRLKRLDRRSFLRSSGVAVALPLLEAMRPASAAEAKKLAEPPKRLLLIGRPLGLHAPFFFPEKAGLDYEPSRYLKLLEPYRKQFTVFSGMSHRYMSGGHHGEVAMMTAVRPDNVRFNDIRNGISLDQEVASRIGNQTRFASLVIGGGSIAYTRRGVSIPSQQRSTQVFKQLFLTGSPQEQAREFHRLREGQSILDDVGDQIKTLNKELNSTDRHRLDLYLSSVREAEMRLQQDEKWVSTPKPKVEIKTPVSDFSETQLLQRTRQWHDIVHLALQTDSTRVISLWLGSNLRPEIDGVTLGHHDASHHGQDPNKLEQLAKIEEAELRVFGEFLEKLRTSTEGEQNLLDRTTIFTVSNLGNASSHDNSNLPVLLAGGGYRHQGHVAYDRKNNKLIANLFVRILQQMDIEASAFGASTGVLSEV